MKKVLLSMLMVIALVSASFAGDLALSVRTGAEMNSNYSFNWLSAALNVDVVLEKAPVIKDFMTFGNVSLKPYIGVMMLPMTFNQAGFNLDNIFGGMYAGINTEYKLSDSKKSDKIFVEFEDKLFYYFIYSYALKIGYKTGDISTGIKLNNIFSNYYNSVGVFANYTQPVIE